MTKKQFDLRLIQLANANAQYKRLLSECEEEYKRRFGHFPSDVDDDHWIDCFHIGSVEANADEVIKHAKACC